MHVHITPLYMTSDVVLTFDVQIIIIIMVINSISMWLKTAHSCIINHMITKM